MTLRRAEKRLIREAVNKACAARVRTTPLTDAYYMVGVTSDEITAYAEHWRETLAKGLAREPARGEGEP